MRRRRHPEQLFADCSVWLIVVLVGTVLSFPANIWGQEVTASITGKVIDPSSGIIVGAKVTAKHLDRGTLLTTETNASGFYNLPRVPIGPMKSESKLPASRLRSTGSPGTQSNGSCGFCDAAR